MLIGGGEGIIPLSPSPIKISETNMAYNEKARITHKETLRKKKESGYVFFPGGGIRTEEARKKYRETLKRKYANGYINPMQGKHLSEEAKKKVSEAQKRLPKGKPRPRAKGRIPWNKGTKGVQKAWNKGKHGLQVAWNKGLRSRPTTITEENSRIRNTVEYFLWRDSVFKRDNYTCKMCGKVGGVLNAHHLWPFAKFPELRFAINNGITLCKDPCHKKIHKLLGR
ncbi:MAG: hypothetical protein WC479_06195 [Candidatus Izemoplasmatales bacterium]